MMSPESATIFAVSSGAPPAAIAVVRLSGAGAVDAARALAGTLPEPRRAGLRSLRDSAGELLDRALVLVFPGPATATGEDLVELHLHGGRATVAAVQTTLGTIPGLRMAEPGEFTRRALAHGVIDLSAAEGLGDLLMAETEGQRRLALRSAEGAVRREVEQWTGSLLSLAAQVEAVLDHGDEDDVVQGSGTMGWLREQAAALAAIMRAVVDRPPVERARDGLRVVLAGQPNAGKSTLLNCLVERDAAIVAPIAGTTRDRLEIPVVRSGIAFVLTDTAGLRDETGDAIEAIGIARAREAVGAADILLWLDDTPPPEHPAVLWLHARADADGRGAAYPGQLSLSAVTGEGIAELWDRIVSIGRELLPPPDMVALNARQRMLAGQAADAVARASEQRDELLFAEELRAARRALDAITGRAGVEAMLDAMFARFCIGK